MQASASLMKEEKPRGKRERERERERGSARRLKKGDLSVSSLVEHPVTDVPENLVTSKYTNEYMLWEGNACSLTHPSGLSALAAVGAIAHRTRM